MVEIDLQTSLVNIYGPGGSGKSNFIKFLLKQRPYRRHIVFDPMREYGPEEYNVYRPDNLEYDGGNEELNKFLETVLNLPREIRPRYIVVDEAANFLPGGNKTMGGQVSQLAYHNTHIYPGITLITANRHITDLNPTIREMYDHMFVFDLRGDNSLGAADNLASGLSGEVDNLDMYEFIHVDTLGEMTKFSPVEDMGQYQQI